MRRRPFTHFALFQKYRCGTTRRVGPPCSGARGRPSYVSATNACPFSTSGRGRFVVYPPYEKAVRNPAFGSSSTCSSRLSTLTPSQRVSSFVHFVTQLMSTVHERRGRAWNCVHVQVTGSRTRPSMVNVQ